MEVSEPTNQINDTQLEALDISVKSQNINRREFMKLPLAEQAELMLVHYQQDQE